VLSNHQFDILKTSVKNSSKQSNDQPKCKPDQEHINLSFAQMEGNYIAAAKQAISHCNADLKTSQRLNSQSIRFNKPTLKPGKMESKTPKPKL
jgi:hypothetical protein